MGSICCTIKKFQIYEIENKIGSVVFCFMRIPKWLGGFTEDDVHHLLQLCRFYTDSHVSVYHGNFRREFKRKIDRREWTKKISFRNYESISGSLSEESLSDFSTLKQIVKRRFKTNEIFTWLLNANSPDNYLTLSSHSTNAPLRQIVRVLCVFALDERTVWWCH